MSGILAARAGILATGAGGLPDGMWGHWKPSAMPVGQSASIPDISGNGRHLADLSGSMPQISANVVGGRPALTGGTYLYGRAVGGSYEGRWTIFVAFRRTSNELLRLSSGGGTPWIVKARGDISQGAQVTANPQVGLDASAVLAVKLTGASDSGIGQAATFVNGAPAGSAVAYGGGGVGSIGLWGSENGPTNIAECVAYQRWLSNAEIANASAFLMSEYGIA